MQNVNLQLCLNLFWYHYPNEIICNISHDTGWQVGDRKNSVYGYVDCVKCCSIVNNDA